MDAGQSNCWKITSLFALDSLEPRQLLSGGGAFDPTFGSGGIVTQDFIGATRDVAADVAVQTDGKVVVVGSVYGGAVSGSNFDFTMARYDARGRLDRRFGGGDGLVTTDIASTHDSAGHVLIRPDGKILVIGTAGGQLAIVRYKSNGSLDEMFGDGGKMVSESGGGYIMGAELLPDGAVIVLGESKLVRVSADGDETQILATPTRQDDGFHTVHDLLVQPDGRILLSGRYEYMEESEWGEITYDQALQLTRLMPDGTPDLSFGDRGVFRAPPEESRRFPMGGSLALQPDGRIIVVAGLTVARFDRNGTLDPSFGDGGVARHELIEWNNIRSAAVAPDGRIILAGRVIPYRQDADSLLVVLKPDGSLDTKFSRDGILADGSVTRDDEIHAVALAPGGRIVTAGAIYDAQIRRSDFLIGRYQRDGRHDRSFGRRGKAKVGFTGSLDERLRKLVLQPDGKIILAGMSGDDAMIVRYLPDGSLDPSFGNGGLFRDSFSRDWAAGRASLDADEVLDVVLLDDDRLLALLADFLVIRLTADGKLDASFGNGGVARPALGADDHRATAMAVMSDGSLVVVGGAAAGQRGHFAAARFTPDGSPDHTFGENGVALIPSAGWAEHVAVQDDGKIVLVGHDAAEYGSPVVTLVRLLPDGALDPSFSGDGVVHLQDRDGYPFWGKHVRVDTAGRLLVEATRYLWGNPPVLLRFLPDGTLDESYGTAGVWRPPDYFPARNPILLSDGTILGVWNRGLVRFNADGTRHRFFGDNGLLQLIDDDDNVSHFLFAALDAQGRVILAGTRRSDNQGLDLLLTRVVLD